MSTQVMTHQDNGAVPTTRRAVAPNVDVFENKDGLLLRADLPGVGRENLSVKLHEHELTIEGKRTLSYEGDALHQTMLDADFRRSFSIQVDIDPDQIEAKLKNGVLTVYLPKTQRVQSREVEILSA